MTAHMQLDWVAGSSMTSFQHTSSQANSMDSLLLSTAVSMSEPVSYSVRDHLVDPVSVSPCDQSVVL